jgi:hypothetical protein
MASVATPIQDAIATYFEGEKNAVLFPARLELRSLAITLLVFALLELAIGVGLYFKTGPQVDALLSQLNGDPAVFYAAERPRMTIVQRNFVRLEALWLFLIAGAAAIAVWQKRNVAVSGVALGVLVSIAVFLAFDIIAERRGSQYLGALLLP